MTKRTYKNIILMVLLAGYILLYKLYLFDNFMKYSEMLTASFMAVLLTLSIYFLGFRKDKSSYMSENVLRIVVFYLIFTFILMYGVGFFVGFLKNAYSRNVVTLINNIFAPIVIIIIVELFRYVVIWANKDRKVPIWIYTFLLIALEIAINVRTIPLSDFEALFRLSATVLIPVIIKNCVMSYLSYHVGYKVPLLYRLVMDVYGFVVPVIPDFGEYLTSLVLISLPILIYINSFTIIDERNKRTNHIFVKSNFSLLDIPTFIFFAVLAGLISGLFPHYMIGIGSDSMMPKINKGDAVILKKTNGETSLKKNDIIAFENSGRVVVHRITKINKKDGKTYYITKGDANNSNDANPVLSTQVKGVVKMKIPLIAWPTVWLSEFMHG